MYSIELNIDSRDVWLDDAHVAKLDRIAADYEALKRLTDWKDDHKELVRHTKPALTEGLIVGKSSKTGTEAWHYFKSPSDDEDGLMMLLVKPSNGKHFPILAFGFRTDIDDFGHVQVLGEWSSDDLVARMGRSKEEGIQNLITVYCSLMAYMMHYKEVRERVHKETVSTTRTKKARHGKQGTRTVRASRVEYTLSFPSEPSEAREFQRHAEAWGVRGHSRTYKKSGKTVWVRPHVKGTGKVDPKTYKV